MPDIDLDTFEEQAREKHGIPKGLWESLKSQESGGDIDAKSPTGVRGRFQVTKVTAGQYGLDRDDPFHQAVAAAKYLREGYDAHPNIKDENQRWLAAAGRYYGGPKAVSDDGTLSTDSVDGLSNPAKYVTGIATKWGEYNRSQKQSEVQPPSGPQSSQRLAEPTTSKPSTQTAALPRPDLSSLISVGHSNKPGLSGLDLVRSGFQAQRGQSPLQRQARQKAQQAKIDRERKAYEERGTLGQVGQNLTEGFLTGADQLANVANKIYGGLGAIGGGEYEEPIPRLSDAAKEDLATRAEANQGLGAQVTRGIGQAAPTLPAYVGAGALAGPAGVAGLAALQEDWKDPLESAADVVLNTAVPIGAGKLVGAAARPLLRNLPTPALRLAGNIGSEAVGGAAGNVGTALAEGITDPQQLVAQGLIGAATSAPFGARLRTEQAGPTPRQQARAVANEPLPAPQMIRPETRQSRGYLPTEVTKLQGPETRRVIPRVMDQTAYDAEMQRLKSSEGSPRERQAAIENLAAQDLFKADQAEFRQMAADEQKALLANLPPDLARAIQQRPIRLGGPNVRQAGEGKLEPPPRPREPIAGTPELAQRGRQIINPESEPQLARGMYGSRPKPKSRQDLAREEAENIAPQTGEIRTENVPRRTAPNVEPPNRKTPIELPQSTLDRPQTQLTPRQQKLLPAPRPEIPLYDEPPISVERSKFEAAEPLLKNQPENFNKPELVKEPVNKSTERPQQPVTPGKAPGFRKVPTAEPISDPVVTREIERMQRMSPADLDQYIRNLEGSAPSWTPRQKAQREPILREANKRRGQMVDEGQLPPKYNEPKAADRLGKGDLIAQPTLTEEGKATRMAGKREKADAAREARGQRQAKIVEAQRLPRIEQPGTRQSPAEQALEKGRALGETTSLETPRVVPEATARVEPVRPQEIATPEGQGGTAQESARAEVEPYATHQDFGSVKLADKQNGVPRGKVRVVDEKGQFHIINKRSQNQRAILAKSEEPLPPRGKAVAVTSASLPGQEMATKKKITDVPRDEYIKQQIEKTGMGGLSQKAAEAEYGAIYDQAAAKEKKAPSPAQKPIAPKVGAEAPKPALVESAGKAAAPEAQILDSMVKSKSEALRGALIPIDEMRRSSGLSPEQFDQTIRRMVETDELTLHKHSAPAYLSEAERAGLIRMESKYGDYTDPKDGKKYDYYIGAALRNDAGSVGEALQRFAPKPAVEPPTVKGSAKQAGKSAVKSLDEATKGLSELFGGKNKLSSGFTFDADTYKAAKPHFKAAYEHLKETGQALGNLTRAAIRTLKASGLPDQAIYKMKPYLRRFIQDQAKETAKGRDLGVVEAGRQFKEVDRQLDQLAKRQDALDDKFDSYDDPEYLRASGRLNQQKLSLIAKTLPQVEQQRNTYDGKLEKLQSQINGLEEQLKRAQAESDEIGDILMEAEASDLFSGPGRRIAVKGERVDARIADMERQLKAAEKRHGQVEQAAEKLSRYADELRDSVDIDDTSEIKGLREEYRQAFNTPGSDLEGVGGRLNQAVAAEQDKVLKQASRRLTFGRDPNESKGGTTLGSGFGGLQSGFGRQKKAPAAAPPRGSLAQRMGAQGGKPARQEAPGILEKISSARKAGLLFKVPTHLRNLMSNTGFQVTEEAARIPGSLADLAVSAFTGQRGLTLGNPIETAKAGFEGARQGVAEAKKIWAEGSTEAQTKAGQYARMNSGNKLLDTYVNRSFDALTAEDALFKNVALRRALADRSRAQALTEVRQGKLSRADVQSRTDQLMSKPPTDISAGAIADAEVAVFQNKNQASEFIKGGREKIGKGGNFAMDMVLPFDKTPSNIVLKALDYAGVGYARAARQGIKAAINKSMTPEEQRAFSINVGRATTGAPIIWLGAILAGKGLLTGFYDKDEAKETGAQPGSLIIDGRSYQIGTLGPPGILLALGATLHREATKKIGPKASRAENVAAGAAEMITEMPLLESAKNITEAIKRKSVGNFAGRLAGSFIPEPLPTIAKLTDSKERESQGLIGPVATRIPGARNYLKEKPGSREFSDLIDPFTSRPLRPGESSDSERSSRRPRRERRGRSRE